MEDSIMQDAQRPIEGASTSRQYSRTKNHRSRNKAKNRRAHQDWIIEMNITDPGSTPSDTPDSFRTDYCV